MYYFLVNPASRSGRGKKCWDQLQEVLEERQIPYEVRFTNKDGDMTRLARELTSGRKTADEIHLVVLGGDGTVNEAISGIQDFTSTRFSYIPTGSGNDLARDIGLSRNPVKALEQILQAKEATPTDLGVIHYHTALLPDGSSADNLPDQLFVVSGGIGFDAGVCREVEVSSVKTVLNKIGLGKLAYLGVALKQLFGSGHAEATMQLLDPASGSTQIVRLPNLMFVACMSHRFEGGGFQFGPKADAQDGLLDLCCVHGVPKWKVLLVLPTAFWGGHFRFKGVDSFRSSHIRIQTSIPLWVHTDGEVAAKSNDITVSCRRRLLRFYY